MLWLSSPKIPFILGNYGGITANLAGDSELPSINLLVNKKLNCNNSPSTPKLRTNLEHQIDFEQTKVSVYEIDFALSQYQQSDHVVLVQQNPP